MEYISASIMSVIVFISGYLLCYFTHTRAKAPQVAPREKKELGVNAYQSPLATINREAYDKKLKNSTTHLYDTVKPGKQKGTSK